MHLHKCKISIPNNALTQMSAVFINLESVFIAMRYLIRLSKYRQFNRMGHGKQEPDKFNPPTWRCCPFKSFSTLLRIQTSSELLQRFKFDGHFT
jgi:hypothetical protein